MNPRQVFVRDATGLVRQFSWFDALMISTANIAPGIWAIASQTAFVIAADPGADIVATCHLGLLFSLPLAFTYVMLAIVMPRSGAEYVWASRLVKPVVGFMAGWAMWIAILSVVGLITYLESTVVLPVFLASYGYAMANPSLINLASTVSQPLPALIIGFTILIITTLFAGLGAQIFRRSVTVCFVLIMLSALTYFLVLATSTHADFVNALNGFGGPGISYAGIMSQAQTAGWSYVPISLGPTLLGTPLAVLLFAGITQSAPAAGEIKTLKRSMLISILGSLVLAWAVAVIGIQLSVNVFGYDFLQAATAKWPLAGVPWVPLLVTPLVHGNTLILSLIQVGWLIALPWSATGILLVGTRYVFAFSFDQLFPIKLADISERFHFPVKASILNALVATIFFLLAVFTPFLGLFLNAVAIYALVWTVGSLCAIVLPFSKKTKQLASILPGAKWKIPLVSILGVISAVSMLVSFYWNVSTPSIGPSTLQADAILLGIFLAGLVLYFASYSIRKRQGIDLNQIYSEIPPE